MPADVHTEMQGRVLLACTGNLPHLRPALETCRAAWPEAQFTVLAPSPERDALPDWAQALTPESFWTSDVLERLRGGQFGAAVILTAPGDSPHGLGYLCALAGIPERAGVSREFGGQTLTRWVRETPDPLADPRGRTGATHATTEQSGETSEVPDPGGGVTPQRADPARVLLAALLTDLASPERS